MIFVLVVQVKNIKNVVLFMANKIITPIEFLDDKYLIYIYNDYIDGFSIREISWRCNCRGFNTTEKEINDTLDELNQYLL